MSTENNFYSSLNELSDEINKLYGYVQFEGDNFGEPAINSGPCGAFAHAFMKLWNQRFIQKTHIVFIMVKNSDECWHVLVRLPNGTLYDGGYGIHNEQQYSPAQFDIEDMLEYNKSLLEERSYGLDREYPRFCPNFSIRAIEDLIKAYLDRMVYQPLNRIETNRLILRTWTDADLDPMTAIDQDELVRQFLPGKGSREATKANIQRMVEHQQSKGFSLYAVELKKTQEMIGFLGLITPSFEAHFTPAIEIGWRLSSNHWNKGYATEGAKAVLDYAFTQLNLDGVVSFTVVNNLASRRIMEKIGLQHNPKDDFDHPKLGKDSPLQRHVLYRLSKTEYFKIIAETY